MLFWGCVGQSTNTNLPTGFITLSPAFFDPKLPAECHGLLPSGDGSRGLLEVIASEPGVLVDRGIGLFFNDPFLNITQISNFLDQHQISWITNLPSIAQHDPEFRSDLRDVGFSVQAELRCLAQLRRPGLRTMAAISSSNHADMLADFPADAAVVVQTTSELQVSFPSFGQRLARLESINEVLQKQKSAVCAMPLVTATEEAAQASPVVLRPQLLQ